MKTPHIRVPLPGPKARSIVERDAQVVSPSYPREYPFVISHGKGIEAWDVGGNRFLDFAAGIAVTSTGHGHPKVVHAIRDAADRFLHVSSDWWHEGQVRLAERLALIAPMGEAAMSFFCQSGTESVEAALKLARHVTGRPRFIGFLGGFHGRTMGSLSFTSSKYTQQQGFFPTMPGVTLVPYPNSYRPLLRGDDQGRAVLEYIEKVLFAGAVPAILSKDVLDLMDESDLRIMRSVLFQPIEAISMNSLALLSKVGVPGLMKSDPSKIAALTELVLKRADAGPQGREAPIKAAEFDAIFKPEILGRLGQRITDGINGGLAAPRSLLAKTGLVNPPQEPLVNRLDLDAIRNEHTSMV